MNAATEWLARYPNLLQPARWPRVAQIAVAAAVVAMVVAVALWSQAPPYRVLYTNLDNRDGGAIVSALNQMNVPYRYSDDGSALLVPSDRLYDTRLQLASQGLPRSGEAGFELLDQTRFGASQFAEQVNYQRALEGELANSIKSLHAVQGARVHLALPRESLFVRERQPPTASVLLTLYPGRTISEAQVSAITWLVSSSVPHLAADQVSVVDQNGRLLSSPAGQAGTDRNQRGFIDDIEQRAVQRILTVLTPLVGSDNVRAQVSADVDFSAREQTSEVYRPNQAPGEAAVRSEQTAASRQFGVPPAQGVPGALTNQPPVNPVAPIVAAPAPGQPNPPAAGAGPAGGAGTGAQQGAATPDTVLTTGAGLPEGTHPLQLRNDATINYELDRTISHVKQPLGSVRRLSAAVVLNYRDVDGVPEALPEHEVAQLTELVKQAMGYSEARGDTISVINSAFSDTRPPTPPIWRDPVYMDLAAEFGRYLLFGLLAIFLWRRFVRPYNQRMAAQREEAEKETEAEAEAAVKAAAAARRASEMTRYEDNLNTARQMALQDPRAVAMVVRTWMEKKDVKRG